MSLETPKPVVGLGVCQAEGVPVFHMMGAVLIFFGGTLSTVLGVFKGNYESLIGM